MVGESMKTLQDLKEEEIEKIMVWIQLAKVFAPGCSIRNLQTAVKEVFKVQLRADSIEARLKQRVKK